MGPTIGSNSPWAAWLYPKPTGETVRDRQTATVHGVCLFCLVLIGIILLLKLAFGNRAGTDYIILISGELGLLAAMAVNRSERWMWAARIASLAVLLLVSLFVLHAKDGLRSTTMLAFPALMVLAVMVLDRVSYVVLSSAAILFVTALGIMEVLHIIGPQPTLRTPISFLTVIIIDLILLFVALIGGAIARDARSNIAELRNTVHQLARANRNLVLSEKALRESEHRYRSILAASPDHITIADLDLRIVMVSLDAVRLFGYTSEEDVIGRPLTDFVIAEDRARATETVIRRREGAQLGAVEYRGLRRDGSKFDLEVKSEFVRDLEGEPTEFVFVIRDITERKRAELALRDSEKVLRDSQRVAGLGSYALDLKTGVWTSSNKLDDIFGVDAGFERTVESWASLVHPDMQDAMRDYFAIQVLQKDLRFDKEYRIVRRSDGQERWVHGIGEFELDVEGRPLRMLGTIQDITERRLLEAKLHQSQKMDSIGRLAGGVAHDFNNLLTVINGYSQLALSKLNGSEPVRRPLEEILKAGERAAALTRQLLAFSRKQLLQPRPLDINEVISKMRSMLQRLVGEDVEVRVVLKASAGIVFADPHQVEQVVMNLAVNARDAMPAGGKLLIETANADVGESHLQVDPAAPAGRYVLLTVSDTGIGMDEATRRRVFEPFFTTKGVGKGTGLGLSTVHGIVAQSSGHISVYSEPGIGTTFRVYLPALTGTAAEAERPEAAPMPGGRETVLVVEDKEEVRRFTVAVLHGLGYHVIQAENGGNALDLCENTPDRIDLVVTDIVMPNTGGLALAAKLSNLRPETKVLFMSGFTEAAISQRDRLVREAHFIQKPFSPDQLAAKVRAVLAK